MALAMALTGMLPLPAGSADVGYRNAALNNRGRPANESVHHASVSRTGRYVVFDTDADNMPGPDDLYALYLRDRRTDRTRLVSRANDGRPVFASGGVISPNGRFVAFCSTDPDIVEPDTFVLRTDDVDGWQGHHRDTDVFVRDLETGKTRRASTSHRGREANEASCEATVADNGDVAFMSLAGNLAPGDDNKAWDAFVYDYSTQRVRRISQSADGREVNPLTLTVTISGTARHIALVTYMRIRPSDTNSGCDVYMYDRRLAEYSRVRRANGRQIQDGCLNAVTLDLSHNGRHMTFVSTDRQIVDPPAPEGPEPLYVLNRRTGRARHLSRTADPDSQGSRIYGAAVSDDGASVVFMSDGVGFGGTRTGLDEGFKNDVYLWQRGAGVRLLTPGDTIWAWGGLLEMSGDGRFALFHSDSPYMSNRGPDEPQYAGVYLTTRLR